MRIASLLILLAGLASLAAPAVEPITQGEVLVVWGDDWVDIAERGVPALYGELMVKNAVEWEVDARRGREVGHLERDIERGILRSEPTRVLLAVGLNDVWDVRRGQAGPGSVAAVVAGLASGGETIAASGAQVVLATPIALPVDAENAEAGNAALGELATAIRSLAEERSWGLCDLHAAFTAAMSGEAEVFERAARGLEAEGQRLVCERVGGALGMTASPMIPSPELLPLQPRFVIITPIKRVHHRTNALEEELDELLPERMVDIPILYWSEDSRSGRMLGEIEKIVTQRPTTIIWHLGQHEASHDEAMPDPDAEVEAALAVVAELLQITPHVSLMTPLPCNDQAATGAFDPASAAGQRSAAWAAIVHATAARAGIGVIDLYAAARAHHAEHPQTAYFTSKSANKPELMNFTDAGGDIIAAAMRVYLRLPPVEE